VDGVAYSRELAKRLDTDLNFAFCKELCDAWIWEPLLNPGRKVDGTDRVATIALSQRPGETLQYLSAYNLWHGYLHLTRQF